MRQLQKLAVGLLFACGALTVSPAFAKETVKIGLPMPLTGVLAAVGTQVVAGAQLYIALHADTVAGRKVQLLVRDDTSIPDVSKRIAQEMIVNDKVAILGGGLTPSVFAIAPLVSEIKTATVVMVSGTSIVTERSLYFVRTTRRQAWWNG